MATVSWGTPTFGTPVWTPAPPAFMRGLAFGPGGPPTAHLRVLVGPSFFPPARGFNSIRASGSYSVTIPFTIAGKGAAVNALLIGGAMGQLTRFASPKTFPLQYILFSPSFSVEGRVEIGMATGALLYDIPQKTLRFSTRMRRRLSRRMSFAGSRPGCVLTTGTVYRLYCQLDVTVSLRVFRLLPMTPAQGMSAVADLLGTPPLGLWYGIIPFEMPAGATGPGGLTLPAGEEPTGPSGVPETSELSEDKG